MKSMKGDNPEKRMKKKTLFHKSRQPVFRGRTKVCRSSFFTTSSSGDKGSKENTAHQVFDSMPEPHQQDKPAARASLLSHLCSSGQSGIALDYFDIADKCSDVIDIKDDWESNREALARSLLAENQL
ncbi:hypothetical protein U1Q18_010271 [Sarracenia purpurea var. burkii]